MILYWNNKGTVDVDEYQMKNIFVDAKWKVDCANLNAEWMIRVLFMEVEFWASCGYSFEATFEWTE